MNVIQNNKKILYIILTQLIVYMQYKHTCIEYTYVMLVDKSNTYIHIICIIYSIFLILDISVHQINNV